MQRKARRLTQRTRRKAEDTERRETNTATAARSPLCGTGLYTVKRKTVHAVCAITDAESAEARGLAEVLCDFAGGVVAGGAGYAVAGVGAVAAEVEAFYGSGVAGPAEEGAHGENLVQG